MDLPPIKLAGAQRLPGGFPLFAKADGIEQLAGDRMLAWLRRDAPWRLVETDFYEQHEFSMLDVALPAELGAFTSDLGPLREEVETLFQARLSERVDITAHKLVRGQTIRIHNDYLAGQETHRVLAQLNQGWLESHGGMLMAFRTEDPTSLTGVIKPENLSVQAFEISPKSFHAVSTVHAGERFTIVYSFYGE